MALGAPWLLRGQALTGADARCRLLSLPMGISPRRRVIGLTAVPTEFSNGF